MYRQGERVIITCENCEPELATVQHQLGHRCEDCGDLAYLVQTEHMRVLCCGTILRPLN